MGSLRRRLRNCLTGVRAEPFAYGAQGYVDLELYLMDPAGSRDRPVRRLHPDHQGAPCHAGRGAFGRHDHPWRGRAGEAGKGFAVVASEVKTLANQAAKATDEIASQIAGIQTATTEAVGAIASIGGVIGEVHQIATTIAAAVEEQGAVTQEIARNVQEAANGTQEVTGNISGVTQAAGETGAAASQMLAATSDLAKQATTLRIEVDRFLADVKAA